MNFLTDGVGTSSIDTVPIGVDVVTPLLLKLCSVEKMASWGEKVGLVGNCATKPVKSNSVTNT